MARESREPTTVSLASAPGEWRTGTVVEFDFDVGLGGVEDAGGLRYRFHCTQIAGDSRTIEVGTPVAFVVVAGRCGAWEAAGVRPLESPGVRGLDAEDSRGRPG
jgi:cold shock CspA family protein